MVTLQALEKLRNNTDRDLCGYCIRGIKGFNTFLCIARKLRFNANEGCLCSIL